VAASYTTPGDTTPGWRAINLEGLLRRPFPAAPPALHARTAWEKPPMQRRRRALLGAAAASAAPLVLAAPAVAQSSPEVRWRMSSAFPRSLDVLFGTGERIAQRVAALTENRFQIRFFPAGEVVPGF